MLKALLGTRVGLIGISLVVAVLAVTWISYSLIQSGRSTERLETEVRRNEQQIETRRRIDKAVRNNSGITDHDLNVEWLLQRNRARQ
jgi:hypothetical protein